MNPVNTLCLFCDKACGDCSWSADFIPVKGWEAEPTEVVNSFEQYDSYFVKSCPEFVPDKPIKSFPYYDKVVDLLRGVIHFALLERRLIIQKRPKNFEELKPMVKREMELADIDEWIANGCNGLIDESFARKLGYGERFHSKKAQAILMGEEFHSKLIDKLKKAIEDIKHEPCFSCTKKHCGTCKDYNKFVWKRWVDEEEV